MAKKQINSLKFIKKNYNWEDDNVLNNLKKIFLKETIIKNLIYFS